MQRRVRKRCGFGCVVCGLPLYHIHHIHGFDPAKGHVEAELTLLCPQHHDEADEQHRILPIEQIVVADRNPINIERGWSAPWGGLHFQGTSFVVEVGGNEFRANQKDNEDHLIMIPIAVDEVHLIAFRISPQGEVLVYINAFDHCNRPILIVRENWIVQSTIPWDIRFQGRRLTIREAARNILYEIELAPPERLIIRRGRLLCNGAEIIVRPNYLLIPNIGFASDTGKWQGVVGIQVGPSPIKLPSGCRFEATPRYFFDRKELKRRMREFSNSAQRYNNDADASRT